MGKRKWAVSPERLTAWLGLQTIVGVVKIRQRRIQINWRGTKGGSIFDELNDFERGVDPLPEFVVLSPEADNAVDIATRIRSLRLPFSNRTFRPVDDVGAFGVGGGHVHGVRVAVELTFVAVAETDLVRREGFPLELLLGDVRDGLLESRDLLGVLLLVEEEGAGETRIAIVHRLGGVDLGEGQANVEQCDLHWFQFSVSMGAPFW